MNPFSSIDCLVEDGAISESKADTIRPMAKWLNGLQEEDLLMFIAAGRVIRGLTGIAPPIPVGPIPSFDWYPALGSFASTKGPTPAFSRASAATMIDVNGNVVWGPENLIENSDSLYPYWFGPATISDGGYASPDGDAMSASLLMPTITGNPPAADASGGNRLWMQANYPAGPYTMSVWVKTHLINTAVSVFLVNGDSDTVVSETQVTSSGTWQRISTSGYNISPAGVRMVIAGSEAVLVFGAMISRGTILHDYLPTTSAPVFGPRITYDPITHECLGYLAEEQRTNICVASQEFESGLWSKNGAFTSVTANASIGPDGLMTADQITIGATSVDYSLVYQPLNVATGKYAYSIWFKGSVGGEQIWLSRTTDGVNYASQVCVLTTSWKRFVMVYDAVGPSDYIQFGVDTRDTTGGQSSSTAQTFYAWGAQLEAGSFPTSYIPTTTAAATRSADVCQLPEVDFPSFYNIPEGTIVSESMIPIAYSGNGVAWQVGLTDANRYVFNHATGDMTAIAGYSAQANFDWPASLSGELVKLAFAYKLNDFASSKNGASTLVDTSGVGHGDQGMHIGYDGSGAWLNGTIARITYYPVRLPDTDLVNLTQP